MIARNLLLICVLLFVAILSLAEAGHHKKHKHSKGWKKLVHSKCKSKDEVVLAIGGPITKDMRTAVARAINKEIPVTLFVTGRDVLKPKHKTDRRRNVEFLRKVGESVTIGVLPWSPSHKLKHLKPRKVLKQYQKSQKALTKVLGAVPRVAYMSSSILKRCRVKWLVKKGGFMVVSHTTTFEHPKHDLKKRSFIVLRNGDKKTRKLFGKITRKITDAMLKPVTLSQCLKEMKPYGKLRSSKSD